MCLAVPATVMAIEGDKGAVEVSGVRYQANLMLLDEVNVGDVILLHAGFAIQRLDPQAAAETIALYEELNEIKRQYHLQSPEQGMQASE